ncbi:hypothetical protein ACLI4R_16025 [Natrialbaceae archaeon A-chndr2]
MASKSSAGIHTTSSVLATTVRSSRGTGTRDEDQITNKVKAKALEDAREDVDTLREYIHDLAEDTRQIQLADPHE